MPNVEDVYRKLIELQKELVEITTIGIIGQATEVKQDVIISELQSINVDTIRPIEVIESTVSGSTLSGVQSMSILFDGKNGTLDGISVPDGYVASFSPNGINNRVDSIAYTVPNTKGQRVVITYVKVS